MPAIDAIEPAGDIIARIVREAHAVITERLTQLVGTPAPLVLGLRPRGAVSAARAAPAIDHSSLSLYCSPPGSGSWPPQTSPTSEIV